MDTANTQFSTKVIFNYEGGLHVHILMENGNKTIAENPAIYTRTKKRKQKIREWFAWQMYNVIFKSAFNRMYECDDREVH